MNVWIIVGDQITRKSSTIRALTGVASCSVYEIMPINNAQFPALVITGSLQEYHQLMPREFFDLINSGTLPNRNVTQQIYNRWNSLSRTIQNSKKFDNVVLCLWEHGAGRGQNHRPDANVYINYFLSQNWNIPGRVITFNQGYIPPIPYLFTTSTVPPPPVPTNQIAYQIRNSWGWF